MLTVCPMFVGTECLIRGFLPCSLMLLLVYPAMPANCARQCCLHYLLALVELGVHT